MAGGHALIAAPYDAVGGPWFPRFCLAVKWLSATGVPLFFVISGFCIHLAYAKRGLPDGRSRFRFGEFWRRRLWRLYPTYAVVLCLSMALVVAQFLVSPDSPTVMRYPEPRPSWMGADLLVHALMLHGLHPFFDQGGGNPPFWTLAREEYLYLMYPLILWMRPGLGWGWLAGAMAGITLLVEIAAPHLSTGWAALLVTSAPALWIQWYLGSVAADAYCGRIRLPAVFSAAWVVPVWLVAAYTLPLGSISLGLGYFTLVNACVRREARGRWHDRGVTAVLTAAGVWSYSLYLVHHPVQTVLLSLSLRIGTFDTPLPFVMRALVLTGGSCAAALVLFVGVESRFLRQVPITTTKRHKEPS